jgi:5-methylcytosine-specific restriction protein A
MKGYMLLWNPEIDDWNTINDDIKSINEYGETETSWDCKSSKPEAGDIFFITAVNPSPNLGIFCSGIIDGLIKKTNSLIKEDRITNILYGNINLLLNPYKDKLMNKNIVLNQENKLIFNPRLNGGIIESEYLNGLIKEWENYVIKEKKYSKNIFENDYWEGGYKQSLVSSGERSSKARNDCIKFYGYKCKCCQIDLTESYGPFDRKFIHVHHSNFLSFDKTKHKVDPIKDLIPLCPNCHSMLHIKFNGKFLTLEELKRRVLKQS